MNQVAYSVERFGKGGVRVCGRIGKQRYSVTSLDRELSAKPDQVIIAQHREVFEEWVADLKAEGML